MNKNKEEAYESCVVVSSKGGSGGVSDYADRINSSLPSSRRSSLPESNNPYLYIKHVLGITHAKNSNSIYCYQIAYEHFGPHGIIIPIYFLLLKMLRSSDTRVVISLHEVWGADSYQSSLFPLLAKAVGKFIHTVLLYSSDSIVFLSELGMNSFDSFVKNKQNKYSEVIPHGVPPSQKPLSVEDAKAEFELDGDRATVATIGFINERKNTELLLEIARRSPHCSVLIAGGAQTDSDRQRVEQLRHNTPSNAIVTGRLSENKFHAAFQAADVVVLPYLDITQSGILNWCAAYSVPVVATQLEQFSRLEDAYDWPKTVEMADIPETVADLLSDDQRTVELANGAEAYAEDHSHEKIVDQYIELFNSI